MEILSDLTRNLVVLIITAAILELLLPRNSFRPYINMVIGLLLMLTILSPLLTLLRMPLDLTPAIYQEADISESDIAERQAILDQLNVDLTLERYKELMGERVDSLLQEEGLSLFELTIELEENPASVDFGRAEQVIVSAMPSLTEGSVQAVEKVSIGLAEPDEDDADVWSDSRLISKIADALGIDDEKIILRVLK